MSKKKYIIIAVAVLLVLGLGTWCLARLPFPVDIDQNVQAVIIEDGINTGTTNVTITGTRTNYLFSSTQTFVGTFSIQAISSIQDDELIANVVWYHNTQVQKITYTQDGSAISTEVKNDALVSQDMTEFALELTDGTVIASSETMYHVYMDAIGNG